jgi:hypothetical protein
MRRKALLLDKWRTSRRRAQHFVHWVLFSTHIIESTTCCMILTRQASSGESIQATALVRNLLQGQHDKKMCCETPSRTDNEQVSPTTTTPLYVLLHIRCLLNTYHKFTCRGSAETTTVFCTMQISSPHAAMVDYWISLETRTRNGGANIEANQADLESASGSQIPSRLLKYRS